MDREETLLSRPTPVFDGTAALSRFRERAATIRPAPRRWDAALAALSFSRAAWLRPATAVLAIVFVVSAAAFTGLADTVLTVFEPKQVAVVNVDPTQLRGIPDPSEYGTVTWIAQPTWHAVADASAAATEAGFTPLAPSALPAGVPAQARYAVMSQARATFRFDEAKAKAAAAKVNATIPPMPAAIAATTLTMSGGPAIMQQFGGAPGASATLARPLMIVQAKAPVVTSNGATVNELRDYALAQPGVPPSVAAQIRAIGDPVATLLVPTGIDLQNARTVNVRGTTGYLIADNTGLGSGIFWLEKGYVIAIMGSLKESDLLALVNSLR